MSNLLLYCGSCHKPVAVHGENGLQIGSWPKPMLCPICNKEVIQNKQAVIRDPVKDVVFTVHVPEPVTKTAPKPTPKPEKAKEVDKKVQVDQMKGLISKKYNKKKNEKALFTSKTVIRNKKGKK